MKELSNGLVIVGDNNFPSREAAEDVGYSLPVSGLEESVVDEKSPKKEDIDSSEIVDKKGEVKERYLGLRKYTPKEIQSSKYNLNLLRGEFSRLEKSGYDPGVGDIKNKDRYYLWNQFIKSLKNINVL
ncbi:MAG: hypothetical protein WDZ69_02125 [Candidatus Pacearchaeota archaeon]